MKNIAKFVLIATITTMALLWGPAIAAPSMPEFRGVMPTTRLSAADAWKQATDRARDERIDLDQFLSVSLSFKRFDRNELWWVYEFDARYGNPMPGYTVFVCDDRREVRALKHVRPAPTD